MLTYVEIQVFSLLCITWRVCLYREFHGASALCCWFLVIPEEHFYVSVSMYQSMSKSWASYWVPILQERGFSHRTKPKQLTRRVFLSASKCHP
jgi:hypothetical protein